MVKGTMGEDSLLAAQVAVSLRSALPAENDMPRHVDFPELALLFTSRARPPSSLLSFAAST